MWTKPAVLRSIWTISMTLSSFMVMELTSTLPPNQTEDNCQFVGQNMKEVKMDFFKKKCHLINLANNFISQLYNYSFKEQSSLNTIILTNNSLSQINSSAIINCTNMIALYLNRNKFSEFPNLSEEVRQNLVHLYLSSNSIRSLPRQRLKGFNHLQTFSIHHNPISWIASNATPLPALTSLETSYLSDAFAPENCRCSLKSLSIYNPKRLSSLQSFSRLIQLRLYISITIKLSPRVLPKFQGLYSLRIYTNKSCEDCETKSALLWLGKSMSNSFGTTASCEDPTGSTKLENIRQCTGFESGLQNSALNNCLAASLTASLTVSLTVRFIFG